MSTGVAFLCEFQVWRQGRMSTFMSNLMVHETLAKYFVQIGGPFLGLSLSQLAHQNAAGKLNSWSKMMTKPSENVDRWPGFHESSNLTGTNGDTNSGRCQKWGSFKLELFIFRGIVYIPGNCLHSGELFTFRGIVYIPGNCLHSGELFTFRGILYVFLADRYMIIWSL